MADYVIQHRRMQLQQQHVCIYVISSMYIYDTQTNIYLTAAHSIDASVPYALGLVLSRVSMLCMQSAISLTNSVPLSVCLYVCPSTPVLCLNERIEIVTLFDIQAWALF